MSRRSDGRVAGSIILDAAAAPDGVEKRRRYLALVERFRRFVEEAVPPATRVAVVSKGDTELLRVGNRRGAIHFPRDPSGAYAGWHPASGAHAVELVEAARADGVQYLAFPATALWWLESYADLAAHLLDRYRLLAEEAGTGVIYELEAPALVGPQVTEADGEVEQIESLVTAVMPGTARIVVLAEGAGARCRWPRWPAETTDDTSAAIEEARRIGDFLVVATAGQRSPAHARLLDELSSRGRPILDHRRVCTVYDLRDGRATAPVTAKTVRPDPPHVDAARRIADVARLMVPRGAAVVLVASDAEIDVRIDHAVTARLIVTREADARALSRQVGAWRDGGAQFLILSGAALRALEPSGELADRLDARYRCRWADRHCRVYDLTGPQPRARRPSDGRSAG